MRIYKVKCELDFYQDGKFLDREEESVEVGVATFEQAVSKGKAYMTKTHRGLKPYREKCSGDGEAFVVTYQYKNITVRSCELVAESDI